MDFLNQRDYNGGRIITQTKKDGFIAIITYDYDTYEYILWKSNTKKEVDRSKRVTDLTAKVDKYKNGEAVDE